MIDVDPFEVLTSAPPEFPETTAHKLLQTHYGLDGEFESLTSERDQNFRVRTPGGEEFVLKIANSAEDPTITDLQVSVLMHLEASRPNLVVPRLVRTNTGETQLRIPGAGNRTHTMRMLTWVAGVPVGQVTLRPGVAAQMGSTLAKLGTALSGFEHPASDYPLLWDIKQAGRLEPLLDYVSDLELRSICAQCLRRFAAWTEPRLADCRTQVIFNDLNASNVLVDPDHPDRVVGIIDFGDIVKSPLVIDIAVAAAYLCRGGTSPLDDVFDFLAAYHAESQILANEFALLPELMRMRNVLTIVIASWRAARYPDNSEYILRSVEHARLMLDTLAARDNAELACTFEDYCNGHKDPGKS
jgi:Ser/Thr protein kinase RdoA (MazF antagonist)